MSRAEIHLKSFVQSNTAGRNKIPKVIPSPVIRSALCRSFVETFAVGIMAFMVCLTFVRTTDVAWPRRSGNRDTVMARRVRFVSLNISPALLRVN